jgi:F-type H+-transporting ATPase subunit b
MTFVSYAAGEELNPLIPHTAEIIAGAVAFGLLYLVIRSKVFPMFEKAFAARTEAIQGGIEKAERAQREAEEALQSYTKQLADARGEAQSIREEARVQGAAILEEMRAKAKRPSDSNHSGRTSNDRS